MNLKFSGGSFDKFKTVLDARHQIHNAFPEKKILILATPRSGSTYFCNSLESSGKFGIPEEWLSPKVIKDFNNFSETKIRNIREWYNLVQKTALSCNKVFSIKLMIRQYVFWKNSGFEIPLEEFDVVLYIKRKDFLDQAISLAKARVTDEWDSRGKTYPSLISKKIKISRESILKAMAELASWEDFYETNLSQHVHKVCVYEDFLINPKVFQDTLSLCKIQIPTESNLFSQTIIQRNESDSQIKNEFIEWLNNKLLW